MQTRYESSPKETAGMNTAELRNNFLMETLFSSNQIHLTYSHYDRMILGGIMPTTETLTLGTYEDLKSEYFLERRELGIINVAGDGKITVDGQEYLVKKLDCLYIGRGAKNITFSSINAENSAKFFILSCPAHKEYPTQLMTKEASVSSSRVCVVVIPITFDPDFTPAVTPERESSMTTHRSLGNPKASAVFR